MFCICSSLRCLALKKQSWFRPSIAVRRKKQFGAINGSTGWPSLSLTLSFTLQQTGSVCYELVFTAKDTGNDYIFKSVVTCD